MELIREAKNNIPFSLHDSRITKVEIRSEKLIFYLDNVYEYNNGSEKCYPANMIFEDIDFEECKIMIFDGEIGPGRFSGTRYGVEEFIDNLEGSEFEILTETYGGYDTILEGLVWKDGEDPALGIISIWTMGDIVFEVEG